jgi:hypothetical protein
MNLQDTVAFYGNLSNILGLIGGALVLIVGWALRRRRARADALPELVKVELTAQDTVAQLRQSAFEKHKAIIAATCEALREQAELEAP